MKATPAQRAWQAVVGFQLGGITANLVGVTSIALYQRAHGQFTYMHLLYLSPRERFVWAAAPLVLAVLLSRSRPLVAAGNGASGDLHMVFDYGDSDRGIFAFSSPLCYGDPRRFQQASVEPSCSLAETCHSEADRKGSTEVLDMKLHQEELGLGAQKASVEVNRMISYTIRKKTQVSSACGQAQNGLSTTSFLLFPTEV
jgi:hypothetical protein